MRIAVATRKGLFLFGKSGSTWQITGTAHLGDNVTTIAPSADGELLLAALDHGHFGTKMQASGDGGRTWTESAAPTYPERPDGEEDVDANQRKPIPWATKLIWSIEPGHASEPKVMWAGTIPGGLFRSTDRGASWSLVRSLWDRPERKQWFGGGYDFPGIHSIVVDPRDGKHVTVAVSCGGVWTTFDRGETWQVRASGMHAEYMPPARAHDPVVQDPHRIAQCQAAPDTMWAQHHNGVYRTRDAGEHWTEIDTIAPSKFGFAVAAHPTDPGTAWFIPAIKDEKRIPVDGRLVVARTRDGGATFEQLRTGLPQEHAYDLVFRHALDVDASGDRLAFGSTTGSLWVSEDQGDSWLHVTAHLPPVYTVRFV
jgi:photosystem II stability/assembly factor-like uncharacterized protein